MARLILNLTGGNPIGRLEVLRGLYGPDVEVLDKRGVILREDPVGHLRTAVKEVEAEGHLVVAIILPQNCLGDVGHGDAVRKDIALLRENFRKDPATNRILIVGTDPVTNRDLFEVDPTNGYDRLVKAEFRTEPVEPGDLSARTGKVLVISRHDPEGRQDVINAAFGRSEDASMNVIVDDFPFDGRPRQSIDGAIAHYEGVDAVIVPRAVLRDLRFGDAFGPDVAILTERQRREAAVSATGHDVVRTATAGREAGGRDVFVVESLERFVRSELIMEPVKPQGS